MPLHSPNSPNSPKLSSPSSSASVQRPTLRFLTAGNVDDGKSTLIGRLLYDTNNLKVDQLQQLQQLKQLQSLQLLQQQSPHATPDIHFASLTDGLISENAQNITIDVAHHYLNTPERSYRLLDTPGHEEFTRNMVTAATNVDAAVILIDASRLNVDDIRLSQQTMRHIFIAHLLRIPSIIFAVNKLDLVSKPAHTFERIKTALQQFTQQVHINITAIIPISALKGINVAHGLLALKQGSTNQTLNELIDALHTVYQGPSLLEALSTLPNLATEEQLPLHLPIQWVPSAQQAQSHTIWGRIATGTIQVGDHVVLQPANTPAQVKTIYANALMPPQILNTAQAGQSVGVELLPSALSTPTPVTLQKGQWLEHAQQQSKTTQIITVTLIWLDHEPLNPQQNYLLKHQHQWVSATISQVIHGYTLHNGAHTPINASHIQTNSISKVQLSLSSPLPVQAYQHSRSLGSFILVNALTQQTAAAGLVLNQS